MRSTSKSSGFRISSIIFGCAGSVVLLCGADGGCTFWNTPPGYVPPPLTQQGFATRNTTVLPSNGQIVGSSPRPNQPIRGNWSYNDTNPIGNVTAFGVPNGNSYTAYTDINGNYVVANLIQNANWVVGVNYIGGCHTDAEKFAQLPSPLVYSEGFYIQQFNPTIDFDCVSYLGSAYQGVSPSFTLNTALPSTISVISDVPLSAAYASPELLVFNRTGTAVATESASSIDPSGMSATFPYPTSSSGPLNADMYGTAILNTNADGTQSYAGGGSFFSIGSNATVYPNAFGVAAAELTTHTTVCIPAPSPQPVPTSAVAPQTAGATGPAILFRPQSCSTYVDDNHYPVVTLASSGEVSWNGSVVGVGASPVAVATYGSSTTFSSSGGNNIRITTVTTGTQYAIVANANSNTITILNLLAHSVDATVAVGAKPAAVVVSADNSMAYIANYGDNTVSAVNLNTLTLAGTYAVGVQPSAIDIDSSGNLWVGGNSVISELSAGTYQLAKSIPVSGLVTSLAVSNALGEIVYTLAPGADTTQPLMNEAVSMSNGQRAYSKIVGSATSYVASPISSQLLQPAQLGSGTLVSANYGNDLSISASPGGFVVTELSTGGTVMTGSTPGPIRAIAVDPNYGEMYLTVPDSNAVITVPLPPLPTS